MTVDTDGNIFLALHDLLVLYVVQLMILILDEFVEFQFL
jgi:hypothetical protein